MIGFLFKNKTVTVLIAIMWTVFIFIVCLLPSSDIPKIRIKHIDKIVHFTLYSLFSIFWLRVSNLHHQSLAKLKVFVFAVIIGCIIEITQGSSFIKGRSFEWKDIIANSFGAAFGLLLYQKLIMKIEQKTKP